MNIGQQNIEEGDVEWSITLEYEGSRFRDETRPKNSPKKLATPQGNSQLGSNWSNSKAPDNIRHQVNIGQQNIEEGDVEWSITLEYEGSGGGPLRYHLLRVLYQG